MSNIEVHSLHIYPLKSCAAVDLSTAQVGDRGFVNDRILMLVEEDGEFMTQRDHPRMALIQATIDMGMLSLSAGDMPSMVHMLEDEGAPQTVEVWGDLCEAIDQGDEVADWCSRFLEVPCRMYMMRHGFQRNLDPEYRVSEGDHTGFADGYPFLLISQESLDDLNRRMEKPVPMNRFRPNIVVRGCEPYAEDSWRRIQIGDVVLEVVKPCVRCVITTTDQKTAERFKEPLKTLAAYRRIDSGGVIFGQNLIHRRRGTIKTGMPLQVLSFKQ